jgi:hypothetical protein
MGLPPLLQSLEIRENHDRSPPMKTALTLNIVTYAAVIAVIAWLLLTDPKGDLRAGEPDLTPTAPTHAPRIVTAHDGAECLLWPLEREYASTDPAFFWLCPGAGQHGLDRWGLAWDFRDINARKGE